MRVQNATSSRIRGGYLYMILLLLLLLLLLFS